MNPWVWIGAALAYAAFSAWYHNWRGPLTKAEIADMMAKVKDTPSAAHNDLDVLRAFLEKDDGREFMMLNLVRIAPGDVKHPVTGETVRGADMMQAYTKAFLPSLFARGGHPAVVARKAGGYVDAWKVPADPGWTVMGWMRYRSRRDMMEMVLDRRFDAIFPFKLAGVSETFSFPTRPMITVFVGPSVWVALLLALGAALVQVALLLRAAPTP